MSHLSLSPWLLDTFSVLKNTRYLGKRCQPISISLTSYSNKKEKENKRKVVIGDSKATTGNKHINKKYKIVSNDNGSSIIVLVILVVPGVALGFANFLMCYLLSDKRRC